MLSFTEFTNFFFFSFSNPPPIIHRPLVPARYTINFVRASTSDVSSAVSSVAPVAAVPVVQSPVTSAFSSTE